MKKRRTYLNQAEEAFCQWIEQAGFNPMKRGWPDFICLQGDQVICVEVKDTATHPLKKEQYQVLKILQSYGIPSYRWDLQTQRLQPISEMTSRRPKTERRSGWQVTIGYNLLPDRRKLKSIKELQHLKELGVKDDNIE